MNEAYVCGIFFEGISQYELCEFTKKSTRRRTVISRIIVFVAHQRVTPDGIFLIIKKQKKAKKIVIKHSQKKS